MPHASIKFRFFCMPCIACICIQFGKMFSHVRIDENLGCFIMLIAYHIICQQFSSTLEWDSLILPFDVFVHKLNDNICSWFNSVTSSNAAVNRTVWCDNIAKNKLMHSHSHHTKCHTKLRSNVRLAAETFYANFPV